MTTATKHYVTFYSPGSFVSESTTKPVPSWDVVLAVEISRGIVERYNAKPYAFRFHSQIEHEPIPDDQGGVMQVRPKETDRSAMHFLGGRLRTYEEVKAEANKADETLLFNMRANGYPVVIEVVNGFKSTHPFDETDLIVDPQTAAIVRRGSDPDLVACRKTMETGETP